jgi:hypothetical protein
MEEEDSKKIQKYKEYQLYALKTQVHNFDDPTYELSSRTSQNRSGQKKSKFSL